MGSLCVMDPTGHVELDWDDSSLYINLAPANEPKANQNERAHLFGLVKNMMQKGFAVTVDDKPADQLKEIPKKAKRINLQMDKQGIGEMVGNLVKSDIIGNHVLFRIDDSGQGELIQKSAFKADHATYQATAPLSGG